MLICGAAFLSRVGIFDRNTPKAAAAPQLLSAGRLDFIPFFFL